MRLVALVSTALAVFGISSPAAAQSTFLWSNSSGNDWLQGGDWAGPPATQYPGVINPPAVNSGGNAGDRADFISGFPTPPSPLIVGIDMTISPGNNTASGLLSLGGISFQNNTNPLIIGNSSTTDSGVLQLNGAALPDSGTGATNIILSNTSTSQVLTIQNTANAGTQSMTLAIPTASRIFTGAGATTSITTNITGAGGITSYGAGTLVLSGGNSYTNSTVVERGTLQVANGGSGSATGTGTVSVNSGAKLSGTGTIIPNTGTTAGNTVSVNGTVQPGPDASTGTMTVGSAATNATVSVNSGGTYRWSVSNV